MKITGIHQLEMTTRCNLRCQYCVHPHMPRAKIDMTEEIFLEALSWAKYFINQGTQGKEFNLAGIGESTMHPDFCRWVNIARMQLGNDIELILATNGVGVTEEHAQAMRAARMKVWVSLHRPEKAGPTLNMLRRHNVLSGVSADPSIATVDWAGQVNFEVTAPAPKNHCNWLRERYVMVASDGRILTCCFDGKGEDGVLGTIFDDIPSIETKPYKLCETCHLYKPELAA